jgi:hypothetical protein
MAQLPTEDHHKPDYPETLEDVDRLGIANAALLDERLGRFDPELEAAIARALESK